MLRPFAGIGNNRTWRPPGCCSFQGGRLETEIPTLFLESYGKQCTAAQMVLNLGIPASQYPGAEGSESGRLVICGGGRCVFSDFGKVAGRFDVMTINDITMHLPATIKHVYSNDHNFLPKWCAARRDLLIREFGPLGKTHSNQTGGQITWPWPGAGTSGLGAVYTGLALGYREVILCGIPLDDRGHYFDAPWRDTNFMREVPLKGNSTMKYWHDAREKVFEGRVKSMSGRTRELLG